MRHFLVRSLQPAIAAALIFAVNSALAQGSSRGEAPLGPFAAQSVVVMPVQFLRADSIALVKAEEWPMLRKEIDDSIGTAIAERGIGKKWTYAPEVARRGKRNAGYVSDPYTLGAGGLRTRQLKPQDQLPRVLIDNMRGLIALGDARYALVPVEISFVKSGAASHVVLRLVLIDGRVGEVVWFTDINFDSGKAFNSAAVGVLAQHVADLVSAR